MPKKFTENIPLASKGNILKYYAYAEAWARIEKSQEAGFYLEAITLEESIISDRLLSYLFGTKKIANPESEGKNFSQLIRLAKKANPKVICVGDIQNLLSDVDKWRLARNELLHGFAKTLPGESPASPINDVLKKAEYTAQEGVKLAKAVCSWHLNQLNESKGLKGDNNVKDS